MTTTDDVSPIKVSGTAGLLAAVPPLLGFHPSNSLVLMCLSGERRRIGPVVRVDLPVGHDRAMAAQLTNHARNLADEVVVICYQNLGRRPPLLDDLLTDLNRGGINVMEAITVRGGRARPAWNAAIERAHPGVPLPRPEDPQVRALTAATAIAGRSVLADRQQLRRSIAGPSGARLRRAVRAIDSAAERLVAAGPPMSASVDQPCAADSDSPEYLVRIGPIPPEVRGLVERGFAQVGRTGTVDVELAAAMTAVLTDRLVRDGLLVEAMVELERPWLPMLISCATWTPNALAAPLCSLLAMVAYRHGDGALAQVSVDRCLAAEPEHELAHLMIAIMSAGIHPNELERIANRDLYPVDSEQAQFDRDWS